MPSLCRRGGFFRALQVLLSATVLGGAGMGALYGGPVFIPNGSFEAPLAPPPYVAPYVELRIDAWQKTPKVFWWDETAYGPWDQLIGIFANTPPGDPSRLENCDGSQALYLFANPGVGVFQDYDSIGSSTNAPSHAFDARFEVGQSYRLTAGVTISYYQPPTNGATLELSLYYRDAASNQVTVAATSITNAPGVFDAVTNLVDFQVNVPTVAAGDAWAGRHIGIAILATGELSMAGGVWDVDNVRLAATQAPMLTGTAVSNGQVSFTLLSEPGRVFEILATTNPAQALSLWASLGLVTNHTGSVSFSEPAAHFPGRFYRARQLP